MRISRFRLDGIPLCLIFISSACNMPIGWPEQPNGLYNPGPGGTGPISTEAIVGFPWEKVDFRFTDAIGYYTGYVATGDSVALYFASKAGANIPPLQLDTVRTAYWGVSVQLTTDTTGNVIDYRGDSSTAVMERREDGRGMLKPRKSGYVLTPLASIENRHSAPTVYACREIDCVKVRIVSR